MADFAKISDTPDFYRIDIVGVVRNETEEFLDDPSQNLIQTYKFNIPPNTRAIINQHGEKNYGLFKRLVASRTDKIQTSHISYHIETSLVVEYSWNGTILDSMKFLHISQVPNADFRWESYIFYNDNSPTLNVVYPPNHYWPEEIIKRINYLRNKSVKTDMDKSLLKNLEFRHNQQPNEFTEPHFYRNDFSGTPKTYAVHQSIF